MLPSYSVKIRSWSLIRYVREINGVSNVNVVEVLVESSFAESQYRGLSGITVREAGRIVGVRYCRPILRDYY